VHESPPEESSESFEHSEFRWIHRDNIWLFPLCG
jgi:hypothetical protein